MSPSQILSSPFGEGINLLLVRNTRKKKEENCIIVLRLKASERFKIVLETTGEKFPKRQKDSLFMIRTRTRRTNMHDLC